MFGYFYDNEYKQYCVTDRSGLIHAMFDLEWEAQDYCNRHNAKT